jgi:hypothetical protein
MVEGGWGESVGPLVMVVVALPPVDPSLEVANCFVGRFGVDDCETAVVEGALDFCGEGIVRIIIDVGPAGAFLWRPVASCVLATNCFGVLGELFL